MTRLTALIRYLRAEEQRRKAPASRTAAANVQLAQAAAHLHPDTVAALRRELDAEVSHG